MADMRIFGQVAQSQSPYGRMTPLGQPGALRPSPYKSALGEMLGGMFDELSTPDDSEFREQEKFLLDQIEYTKEQGAYGNPITQRNMDEDLAQLSARLEALRANPPESSSASRFFDGAVDKSKDLFGIDKAESEDKKKKAQMAQNTMNYLANRGSSLDQTKHAKEQGAYKNPIDQIILNLKKNRGT